MRLWKPEEKEINAEMLIIPDSRADRYTIQLACLCCLCLVLKGLKTAFIKNFFKVF